MTIPEYIRSALEASGMSVYELCKRPEFNTSTQRLNYYLRNESVPMINTLLNIESISGLNLDLVDARIKRGMIYFKALDKHIGASEYSIREIAEAIGVSYETLRKWVEALLNGKSPIKIKPYVVINICDWVEGRLKVRRHRRSTYSLAVSQKYKEENLLSNPNDVDLPIDTRRAIEIIEKLELGSVRMRKLKKIEDSLHEFEYGPYDCTLDLRRTPGTFKAVYHPTGLLSVYREVKHA